jgi:hypothetical protein
MTPARFARQSRGTPAQYAGSVSGPHCKPLAERVATVLLAVFLGVSGAMALVHWWVS